MEITIGDYDEQTRQVTVTFEHQDVTFTRLVNAYLDENGDYDEEATAARCEEVGRGVIVKIEAGIIQNAPAEEESDSGETEA